MSFHGAFVQCWNYLLEEPLTAGILFRIDAEWPTFQSEVDALKNAVQEYETEQQQIAYTFRVLQHCAALPLSANLPEATIGRLIGHNSKHEDALNEFREYFLEPFYDYLDDALDQQAAVVSLLVKYKRKVEWFERSALVATAGQSERQLAKHLYGYLFDQGLDFHIEPQSASGEADLVAKDLILDAKVFDGARRSAAYLAAGFNQVHTYSRDFNQDAAFIVIYKTCPDAIDFSFSSSGSLVPFLCVAGKTIYFLVIDICEHEDSASKRGALKRHQITEETIAAFKNQLTATESAVAVQTPSAPI